MSETAELMDTSKLIRWLNELAERQVTVSGSRATFVSDMYFEAASRLPALQGENDRLRKLSNAILELATQLEVIGPQGDHVWLHLRPNHKRATGFCSIRMDRRDPIDGKMGEAYVSWFDEFKKARTALSGEGA